MARAFNPNPHSVNGMGVPVADRPMPTEEQQLRDTLTLLRNSLAMFEDDPNLAAECAQVRAQVRDVERRLGGMQVAANLKACGVSAITPASFAAWAEVQFADLVDAPEFVPAGTCPVCGLSLTEHPHSEDECYIRHGEDADTMAEIEVAFFEDLAQARIDYRFPNQF